MELVFMSEYHKNDFAPSKQFGLEGAKVCLNVLLGLGDYLTITFTPLTM